MIVAPSFLTADMNNLPSEIKSISSSKWLHFDVMDGVFVPNKTYDHRLVSEVKKYSNQFFDCHLMVDNPIPDIIRYVKAGADLITVHIEALGISTKVAIESIKNLNIKVGLSIKPLTNVDELLPYLHDIDLILIMSVEPGKGGQKFIEDSIDKISFLQEYRKKHQLNYLIEVDGGINLSTAKLVSLAGADVIVAGSFIFNRNDRDIAIRELENV